MILLRQTSQNLPSSERPIPSNPQRRVGAVGTTAGHHSATRSLFARATASSKIIFKIIEYALMVSPGCRAANMGPVHGVCMLSFRTSCQQLVTVFFFRTGYQLVTFNMF